MCTQIFWGTRGWRRQCCWKGTKSDVSSAARKGSTDTGTGGTMAIPGRGSGPGGASPTQENMRWKYWIYMWNSVILSVLLTFYHISVWKAASVPSSWMAVIMSLETCIEWNRCNCCNSPPDRVFNELSPRKQPPYLERETDSICCLLMAVT